MTESIKKRVYLKISFYDVIYQGNIIIGEDRSYVDSFMIVNDLTWSSINIKEKTMGVLDFKDKHNPKRKLKEFKS